MQNQSMLLRDEQLRVDVVGIQFSLGLSSFCTSCKWDTDCPLFWIIFSRIFVELVIETPSGAKHTFAYSLGRLDQCLPPEQREGKLLTNIKDSSSLSSDCSPVLQTTHRMCRPSLHWSVATWAQETGTRCYSPYC